MLRFLDTFFSLLGIILLFPFFVLIGFWIKLDSEGPIFYVQNRVGLNGVDFKMYKFRSMVIGSDRHGLLTIGGRDYRVTRSGHFIRKYKIDELAQLWNVLLGEMSLVGPRPEVRKYVDLYNTSQRIVLSVRPGITDEASIVFNNENEILGKSTNPEFTYIHEIMPKKIELNKKFIVNPSVNNYFSIIFRTLFP